MPAALIDPDGGSVDMGSTLTVQKSAGSPSLGSTVEMRTGTFHVKNGSGFVVQEQSQFIMAPVEGDVTTGIWIKDDRQFPTGGQFTVEAGAAATIRKAVPKNTANFRTGPVTFDAKVPKFKNEGQVTIKDGAEILFKPSGTETGAGGVGFVQEGAGAVFTTAESGSKITCEKKTGVSINDGELRIAETNATVQARVTISAPQADAALALANNTVLKHTGNTGAPVAVNLMVDGVLSTHGTIALLAMRNTGVCDLIEVTDRVYLAGTIKLTWFNDTKTKKARDVGDTWLLMNCTYGGTEEKIVNFGLVTFLTRANASNPT